MVGAPLVIVELVGGGCGVNFDPGRHKTSNSVGVVFQPLNNWQAAGGGGGQRRTSIAQHSMAPHSARQHQNNTTQHNTTQHNTTQHNTTQHKHNTTQHNTTQHKHNTTQHNTTQHNTTQHNTTQHNTTQLKTTQHNTTQHNTTQHNTTQHNTEEALAGAPEIPPSQVLRYMGTNIHLQGTPTAPSNLPEVRAAGLEATTPPAALPGCGPDRTA